MKNCFFVLLCVLFLSGCASVSGQRISKEQCATIEKGVTTRGDLVAMFGDPVSDLQAADGKTHLGFMYVRSDIKPTSYIPFVGLFYNGSDTETQNLDVVLDANGVVEEFSRKVKKREMKNGFMV